VQLLFCGVRGSTPVSGPEFTRVGGNTSCVAALARGATLPSLVLDAGTGLQRLAREFGATPFAGTILLTHLHWDHVQGVPFFTPADRDEARTTLAMPAQGDEPAAVLARAMSPPHFPIEPSGLRGHWTFLALDEGRHSIEGFEVTAREIPHKGGRTFGFRVDDGDVSVAYLPDHAPDAASTRERDAAVALARDVDVLVHGGQFVESERELASAYGHATVEEAVELATVAGARRLVLTHHSPNRDDAAVDAIVACARSRAENIEVIAAHDGLRLHLPEVRR
jgi:phosphoribosyl 1,2-cyclic phosphodiesterase